MLRRFLFVYLGLLLLSHLVALVRGPVQEERPDFRTESVTARGENGQAVTGSMRIAFRDLPADQPGAPVVLLVHGSPGDADTFDELVDELRGRYRLIVPDLPGFGASTRVIEDYSFRSHGEALVELLDRLEIARVHALGFSMGGGVVLSMANRAPERIASLTMLSALGVEELELFGVHELNHAVHGFQLLAVKALEWLTPHFGWFRSGNALHSYARNFYDSDQRGLRQILLDWPGPALVVHGEEDFLVPEAAAREHLRLMPQARDEVWADQSHFLPWTAEEQVATVLDDFVADVEAGRATTRADVPAAARDAAQVPWNPRDAPPLGGMDLVLAMLLIAAATLVSEDLTCIATGLLVAQGRLPFAAGVAACFFGILIGDGLLFLLGRWLGRPALTRAPLRWLVRPASVHRASAWFEHKGGKVILLSRFLPGLRLPTYVAAGMLGQRIRSFLMWFAIAGLLWTPALVGLSTWAGKEVTEALHALEGYLVPVLVLLALGLYFGQKLVIPLFTRRGRRLLWAAWRRKVEWEFWPPQVFYLPVVVQVAWLALRHRSLRVVTCVNPGIPTGGLVGESKWQILTALGADPDADGGARGPAGDALPATLHLPAPADGDPAADRSRPAAAFRFLERHGLDWPVIVKPDRGERGRGVEVVRSAEQLRRRLSIDPTELLVQEYVPGVEFGVFWVHEPGEERGRILSINSKEMQELVGDGERTLEQLILADDRAVKQAEIHFEYHAERLYDVPEAGERIHLVEVGAHARGSVFRDARGLATPELAARIEEIIAGFPGFRFGRFDLRAPDAASLQAGRDLRILELNGLTAEVAHIYDPDHPVRHAWADILDQWRRAFRIGAALRAEGHRPSSWGEVRQAWRRARREQRIREEALLRAELEEDRERAEKHAGSATQTAVAG